MRNTKLIILYLFLSLSCVDQVRLDDSFIIACVLVEAALVDNNFGNDEKNIIIKLLKKQYKIKNIEDINSILEKKSYEKIFTTIYISFY